MASEEPDRIGWLEGLADELRDDRERLESEISELRADLDFANGLLHRVFTAALTEKGLAYFDKSGGSNDARRMAIRAARRGEI